MDFAWFIYTISLMTCLMAACATAIMVWVLAGRRDCLSAALGFACYLLDVGIILFDEYARVKPLGDAYFDVGLTHPICQVVLNACLLASLWAWMAQRLGKASNHIRQLLVLVGLLLTSALLAPTVNSSGPLRAMAYWGFRDCAVMGAFAWGLWRGVSTENGAERADLARLRMPFGVSLALAVAALAEDITNILFFRPDYSVAWASDLLWHLTERNISENLLAVWLAFLMIRSARQTMWVFARHPAHDEKRLSDNRVRPDFEVRLLAFADAHGLSNREREVLALALQGKDAQNIASELIISVGTVKAHTHRIYKKCGVNARSELLDGFWRG